MVRFLFDARLPDFLGQRDRFLNICASLNNTRSWDCDSSRANELMRSLFVHAKGGGEYPAANYGNPRKLKHSLHGAVLAVSPMQYGKSGVNSNLFSTIAGLAKKSWR